LRIGYRSDQFFGIEADFPAVCWPDASDLV